MFVVENEQTLAEKGAFQIAQELGVTLTDLVRYPPSQGLRHVGLPHRMIFQERQLMTLPSQGFVYVDFSFIKISPIDPKCWPPGLTSPS